MWTNWLRRTHKTKRGLWFFRLPEIIDILGKSVSVSLRHKRKSSFSHLRLYISKILLSGGFVMALAFGNYCEFALWICYCSSLFIYLTTCYDAWLIPVRSNTIIKLCDSDMTHPHAVCGWPQKALNPSSCCSANYSPVAQWCSGQHTQILIWRGRPGFDSRLGQ